MSLPDDIAETIRQFQDFKYTESNPPAKISPSELAILIDHTLLKPDATEHDIRRLCDEAIKYNVNTVCVNSSWIPLCSRILSKSHTVPIAVIGFPLGAGLTSSKVNEAEESIRAGAKEIDMVIQVGRLRGQDWQYVYDDIQKVYSICGGIPLKVILETSMLTKSEIIAACAICRKIGVAYVKTSTGFGGGGAKVEDVALMKAVVGDGTEVKASGGIRTYEDAMRMFNAGARRIGASATVAIVTAKT
jgi:deoxyribose-phosphate aldolase